MIRVVDRKLTGSRVELDDIARRFDGEIVTIRVLGGQANVVAYIEDGQPMGGFMTMAELDVLEGSEVVVLGGDYREGAPDPNTQPKDHQRG